MEYGKYLRYYESAGPERTEFQLNVEVPSSPANPDYQEYRKQDLRGTLQGFKDADYPGVRWRENGPQFFIDLVAYTRLSGHVDYLKRILGFLGDVNPIDNQLE